MSGDQVLQAAPKHVYDCPYDRRRVGDLARLVHEDEPQYTAETYLDLLLREVNRKDEKLSREHDGLGFTRDNSISGYEAEKFVDSVYITDKLGLNDPRSALARGLNNIYFAGKLFTGEQPLAHSAKIKNYHDLDTATVYESTNPQCSSGVTTVSTRINGIDGPEVGYYDEVMADGSRLIYGSENLPEGTVPTFETKKDYPYSFPPMDRRPVIMRENGEFKAYKRVKGGNLISMFVVGKMVGDVDKIHKELSRGLWEPKQLNYWDRVNLNKIIALTIDYTGKVATVPMDDLLTWGRDKTEEGAVVLFNSQIRWTNDKTPLCMCGLVQYWDPYCRMLTGIMQPEEDRIERYIKTRLSDAMSRVPVNVTNWENAGSFRKREIKKLLSVGAISYESSKSGRGKTKEFVDLHDVYKVEVQWALSDLLEKSKNENVKKAALAIVDSVRPAREIFSKENTRQLAVEYSRFTTLMKPTSPTIKRNQVVFGLIAGLGISYDKYPTEMTSVNDQAEEVARRSRLGFYSGGTKDLSFPYRGIVSYTALKSANSKRASHNLSDCLPIKARATSKTCVAPSSSPAVPPIPPAPLKVR